MFISNRINIISQLTSYIYWIIIPFTKVICFFSNIFSQFYIIWKIFQKMHQSFISLHKIPVILLLITCLNAPKLLATVGTLTKAAWTHLFSLLTLINILYSKWTILISKLDIISGNNFQSKYVLFIICEEKQLKNLVFCIYQLIIFLHF